MNYYKISFVIIIAFISCKKSNDNSSTVLNKIPKADFNFTSKNSGIIPDTVNFTSTSTNATSYKWNFGNGNTSTTVNPQSININKHKSGVYDAMPLPKDGEDDKKNRELWFESIHRAAPGTDWRAIEAQNQLNIINLRSNYLPNKVFNIQEESFANGLLKGNWEERGSENQAGRNTEAEYDPSNNDFYAISNNGILWKKNLSTGNWVVLNRAHFDRNILKLVKKTNGTNRLILSYNNQLIYTDDNGQSFSQTFLGVNNPLSLTTLDDATQSIYCLANDGMYISTNQGQSFTRFFTLNAGDGSMISLHKTHNSNELYLLDTRFTNGIRLYSITGSTLSLLNTGTGTEINARCILRSVNIGGTTTWYVLINGNKVYRSINAGANWTLQNTVPGAYTFEISMDDPLKLFVGGLEANRSFNGGISWILVNGWTEYYGNITSKLHGDIMRLSTFRKTDGSSIIFINNDGGTAISNDNLVTTSNISLTSLRNSEYYDVLTDQETPDNIFSGSQDQGLQRNLNATMAGVLNFDQIIAGDYTQLAISGGTVRHLWAQYPGANIYYYNNSVGGLSLTWRMPGSLLPNYGWTMPITSTSNPKADEVLIGGGDLSGGNGSYVMKLKPTTSSPFSITPTQYNYNFRTASNNGTAGVTAIETVRADSNRIYVATEDGTFFYTTDAGKNWSKPVSFSGPGPAFLFGSSIYSSRLTPNLLWYGGTGYSNSPVFKSTDGGKTFTDIRNGLPSTYIYKLVANPSETMLFAATEAGPYVYIISDGRWYQMIGSNNPFFSYTTVQYVEDLNVVRFGTYARGIWDFQISNAPPPAPRITISGATTFCQGDSVILTSSASSGNQWYKEGVAIAGAVNNTYTATQAGSYTAKTTINGNTSIFSAAIIVTINPISAEPGAVSGANLVCQSTSQTYSVTPVTGATSYTWTVPSGWTGTSTTNIITVTVGTSGGTISVRTNNNCGSSNDQTLNVSINPVPTLTLIRDTTLLSSIAFNYRWFFNNNTLNGETSNSIRVKKTGFYRVETSPDKICWIPSIDFPILVLPDRLVNDTLSMDIYPNPTPDIFNVVVRLQRVTNITAYVTVTNVSGSVVLQTDKLILYSNEVKIPVNLNMKGSFFVKVYINGDIKTMGVIIQ